MRLCESSITHVNRPWRFHAGKRYCCIRAAHAGELGDDRVLRFGLAAQEPSRKSNADPLSISRLERRKLRRESLAAHLRIGIFEEYRFKR